MKERPILLSTPMVQATLEKRKNITRRTKGLNEINKEPDRFVYLGDSTQIEIPRKAIPYDDRIYHAFTLKNNNDSWWVVECPYGKAGDRLWVRETFLILPPNEVYYKADKENNAPHICWTPSIFMPRKAARINLLIKSIRVERLQDISEDDAKKEGVFIHKVYSSPRMEFANLWESINGKGSWEKNPWVWVIEFERIEI